MRLFSFAVLLAMSVALLSCSNGPMLESGMFKQGYYEEDPHDIAAPPNTDISADEVELYCRDMSFEESIDCVANLNDKKQEDYKTWQAKKSEPPKKQTAQKKQTKKTTQTKQTTQKKPVKKTTTQTQKKQ